MYFSIPITTHPKWKTSTIYILCLFLACVTGFFSANGQISKKELELKKKKSLEEIRKTQKLLDHIENKQSITLNKLKLLNTQIKSQESYIDNLLTEMTLIKQDMTEIGFVVGSLSDDLVSLQKEYQELIYRAYKNSSGLNQLTFIFSADSFKEFLLRAQYINQITEIRKTQLQAIQQVQQTLLTERSKLASHQIKREELLKKEEKERQQLVKIKNERTDLVKLLSNKKGELWKELKQKNKSLRKIDNLIANLVIEERNTDLIGIKSPLSKVTAAFKAQKKRLTWPVKGVIISTFGKQKHPVLKGVDIDNQGISVQTEKEESVHVVFKGKVVTVAYVPGMHSVVIVQHGEYYTLYARMGKVYVKKGQYIEKGQTIGVVYTDDKNISELDFQVWKKNVKMNPENWLKS